MTYNELQIKSEEELEAFYNSCFQKTREVEGILFTIDLFEKDVNKYLSLNELENSLLNRVLAAEDVYKNSVLNDFFFHERDFS